MRHNYSFPKVSLMINKPSFFALVIFVLATGTLMAIDKASAELITFDEYPQGTFITNQYQHRGVIFSGASIIRYSDGSGGAIEGGITASFVDPTDGTPVEVTNLSYEPFYLWWGGTPTTVTYYDISGGIVRQDVIAPWLGQDIPPDYPPRVQKFVIAPGVSASARIDNLRFQIAPEITLSRADLMTIQTTGKPGGGTFAYNVTLTSGANPPAISFANGYTNTTNPNIAKLSNPKNPSRQGVPTAGGLSEITASYSLSGNTAQKSFSVPTFGMSCYNTALESDWGTPPKNCAKTPINKTIYSGTIKDPYGYPGTYCNAFIATVKLQGSGVLNSGQKIQYINGKLVNVDIINGADGTPVVAGQTVARDIAIIPSKNSVYVTVDKINNNNPLLANDTGSQTRIAGYRLDWYAGIGKAVCNGFNNVISVSACTPEQAACPSINID